MNVLNIFYYTDPVSHTEVNTSMQVTISKEVRVLLDQKDP